MRLTHHTCIHFLFIAILVFSMLNIPVSFSTAQDSYLLFKGETFSAGDLDWNDNSLAHFKPFTDTYYEEPTPTVTPTPRPTPVPTPTPDPNQPIIRQEDGSLRLTFSGASDADNQVSIMGAGWGEYPQADVRYGAIPTDNAFHDATDGRGAIIEADPGEGAMIFGPVVNTDRAAAIRCSLRANLPDVSIYLASVDQGQYTFVSTITPSNGTFFLNRYSRLADFFLPPSTGFQPLLQIINKNPASKLTVYLDNWDIILLDPSAFYHAEFLDGDENDPDPIRMQGTSEITIPLNLPEGAKPLKMALIPAGTFMMG